MSLTGNTDLHLGNALLRLPSDFDALSIEELYGKYSAPVSSPVVHDDNGPLSPGVPKTATVPLWLGKPSEDYAPSNVNLLISDFGEAFMPSTEHRYESHAPIAYAPPESVFEPEKPLTFSSDIWTLACAIWSILGQRPLFEEILALQDDITAEQIDVLGTLPPEWWSKWQGKHEYFTEDGGAIPDRYFKSWNDRFESHIQRPGLEAGISAVCDGEKSAVLHMLRSMLEFEPERRASAEDILQCDWIQNWALPERLSIARSTT